ncbi:MAG: hypothetical protein IPJ19_11155 [Planctomycetes bacterium]|nr:hypothetical protein [Planctomycetota bacterium]
MASNELDVAVLASELFESLGVGHFVGGSTASSFYGESRMTHDVDIAVALRHEHVAPLLRRASGEFFVEPEFVEEAVRHSRMFTMVHRTSFVKVDVYVRPLEGFFQSELQRARLLEIRRTPPGEAWMPTPEDIVLQKLAWYQKGECVSERQWRDILGVLRNWRARVDLAYLRQWAKELDVAALLETALVQAAEG